MGYSGASAARAPAPPESDTAMNFWPDVYRWMTIAAIISSPGIGVASRGYNAGSGPPNGELRSLSLTGLENVFQYSDRLYGGSGPESPAALDSLQRLGIKTIVSVDGARPDVAAARKRGMRYVHLPFGYDGCPPPTAARIVKAVRDLPAPIYIHCHHGKHRGPTAVAFVRIALYGLSPDQAVNEMERAGTGRNYLGLYKAVRHYRRPDPSEIDRAPSDYPEAAPSRGMTDSMVTIGREWERLILCREAGWRTPASHPDLQPAHQALLLREAFHELARRPEVKRRSKAFRASLQRSEDMAVQLENALRAHRSAESSAISLRIDTGCQSCHQSHRDPPGASRE